MTDDLRWWDPYAGLPAVVQVVFWVLLVVTVSSFVWVLVLAVTAWAQERALARRARVAGRWQDAGESDFLWVFVVPALDEEVTIRDSVTRLAAVTATLVVAQQQPLVPFLPILVAATVILVLVGMLVGRSGVTPRYPTYWW